MSARKTVLVEVNSLELGGTQLNAVDLARAVRDFGYDSVLFGPLETLPASGPNLFDVAAEMGVRLGGFHRNPTVISGGARSLEERARSIGADLVHLYGVSSDPRRAYWGPCRFGRLPLVHTVYEMSLASGMHQHTPLVIGTGYLRDELADRAGPTWLISPPVDTERDAPDQLLGGEFRRGLGELSERVLVVIVSRLDRQMKGYPVETAIRAMALLAQTDAALVIVGDGTERERLERLADQVNAMSGRRMVTFIGAMSDPRPAYAAADVSVGMGGSAARALAFASPLVVHGEGGTAELFQPSTAESLFRRSFWSAEPQDDAAAVLAEVLRPLVADASRRRELADFGRDFALAHFSLEAMARRLAAVYDDALQSYGRMAWLRDVPREAPRFAGFAGRRLAGVLGVRG